MIALLLFLIIPPSTYGDATYFAPEIYKKYNYDLGPLLDPHEDCYGCDQWNYCEVSVRPLYNDEGLPLYEIFDEENFELVGFEFRLFKFTGFSTMLTLEEKFLYIILIL